MKSSTFSIGWIVQLLCAAVIALPALGQSASQPAATAKPKPEYDMGRVQLMLLYSVPGGRAPPEKTFTDHRTRIKELLDSGQAALAGSTSGAGPLSELLVFKTESADTARDLTASLPLVNAGLLKPEQLTWYTARNVIKTPATPAAETRYIFGLLVRGPKSTNEVTDESRKIQEGHMANINRLAEAGKLVLAGPFADGGHRRGVFIFKVDTIEEAKALCDTDPAVQAGRLTVELYRWTVPAGILP